MYLNQIEWEKVLTHWLFNGEREIQMHAKFLCSLLAPAIDHARYDLFTMSRTEIDTVIGLLANASNSPALSVTGCGIQFSALELVENMIYLCLSPSNLTAFASTELMPTIISLLVQQNSALFKAVIRLVWILLDDSNFQNHSEPFMDDVMEMCLAFSADDCELRFLTNLLQFALNTQGTYLRTILLRRFKLHFTV